MQMFHGVWQLTKLTLASDGRRLGLHGLRFGMVVTLYLAVCFFQFSSWRTATGQQLFQSQLQITLFFLSMNAVFGFSQVITEEKEEDTLGLMRLADVSPLAIILAKASSVLCDSGFLVALQFPFTIIAITLGGVSWPQVVAACVALGAYLWLLVFVSLLASTTQPTGAISARVTAIAVGGYVLVPWFLMTFSTLWGTTFVSRVFERVSLSIRLNEVTESTFDGSPWCSAVAFGLITGLICLIVSWLVFDRYALIDSATETPSLSGSRQRMSQRSWSRPVIWREYVFCLGGVRGTVVRIAVPCGIFIGVRLWLMSMTSLNDMAFAFAWTGIFTGFSGLLDGSWSASRLFRDEIRDRTWSSLVQTPCTLKQLILEKYRGWALGLAPTIIAPFLMILAMMVAHKYIRTFLDYAEVSIGTLSFGLCVFGYLHLLVLLSLYFGWKAVPMAFTICMTAATFYLKSVSFAWNIESRCMLYLFTDLVIIALMCWFQRQIVVRLSQLAEIA